MWNVSILPFRPKKGETFSLIVPFIDSGLGLMPSFNAEDVSAFISKDNGTYTETTNSATLIGLDSDKPNATRSTVVLELTTDEMDADNIVVNFNVDGEELKSIIIYTNGFTGFADNVITLSPGALNLLAEAHNKNYTVKRAAYNESGFNYIGLTKTNGKLWLIIRDKTDFTETKLILGRESTSSFSSSWANRTNLAYQDSEPL